MKPLRRFCFLALTSFVAVGCFGLVQSALTVDQSIHSRNDDIVPDGTIRRLEATYGFKDPGAGGLTTVDMFDFKIHPYGMQQIEFEIWNGDMVQVEKLKAAVQKFLDQASPPHPQGKFSTFEYPMGPYDLHHTFWFTYDLPWSNKSVVRISHWPARGEKLLIQVELTCSPLKKPLVCHYGLLKELFENNAIAQLSPKSKQNWEELKPRLK